MSRIFEASTRWATPRRTTRSPTPTTKGNFQSRPPNWCWNEVMKSASHKVVRIKSLTLKSFKIWQLQKSSTTKLLLSRFLWLGGFKPNCIYPRHANSFSTWREMSSLLRRKTGRDMFCLLKATNTFRLFPLQKLFRLNHYDGFLKIILFHSYNKIFDSSSTRLVIQGKCL